MQPIRLLEIMREETPCETCAKEAHCRQERTACSDFAFYVETGRAVRRCRFATPVFYARLFPSEFLGGADAEAVEELGD